MSIETKGKKRKPRRGRMLLVAGAGAASLIGLGTACGVGVHGVNGIACQAPDCGPFGTVVMPGGPDGGEDAGLDAGPDAGADAGGPFGLFTNPDGGEDAG